MKIYFVNLGCAKNQTDLEYLIGKLKVKGYEITLNPNEASYIIINTCGFIEPAVNEAIENILEHLEYKIKGKKIIVSGCMVERYKNEFEKEFPEVDYYTGVGNLENIIEFIENKNITTKSEKNFYGQERVLLNTPYFAYLKIAEGCNNRCSYCTIPSIRGNLISRDKKEILIEAKNLVSQGVKEIIIISQDITKYGLDKTGKPMLRELLEDISNIKGNFFIRLLYMNPDGIDKDLVDFIGNNKKIINYFEIPIQHISDKILKLMNRKSDATHIKTIFEYIKSNLEDSIIRTTFIIGFPGETQKDIDELENFILKYKPDFAGFFPYYDEEGVKASKMKDKVAKSIIKSRISKLQKLQKINTKQKIKELKRDEIICFVDKANDDFDFILEGRALFQAPEVDGKAYFIEGIADIGYGPYICKIKRIVYPDIYCKIIKAL